MNAAATVGQRAVLTAREANAGPGRPGLETEPGGEGSAYLAGAAKLHGVGRNTVVKARRLLRLASGTMARRPRWLKWNKGFCPSRLLYVSVSPLTRGGR